MANFSSPVLNRKDFENRFQILCNLSEGIEYTSGEFLISDESKDFSNVRQLFHQWLSSYSSDIVTEFETLETDRATINTVSDANDIKEEYVFCHQNAICTKEVATKFSLLCHKDAADIFDQLSFLCFGNNGKAEKLFGIGIRELFLDEVTTNQLVLDCIKTFQYNQVVVMILVKLLARFSINLYVYQHINSFQMQADVFDATPILALYSQRNEGENGLYRPMKWVFIGHFNNQVYLYYSQKDLPVGSEFPLALSHRVFLQNLSLVTDAANINTNVLLDLSYTGRINLIKNKMKENGVWTQKNDAQLATVFGRDMSLVVSFEVTPKQVYSPWEVIKANYRTLHEYGAIKLSLDLKKFRHVMPQVKDNHASLELDFTRQYFVEKEGCDLYKLVHDAVPVKMTLEEALAKNLQTFKENPSMKGTFHEMLKLSSENSLDTSNPGYFYHHGTTQEIYENFTVVDKWIEDLPNDLNQVLDFVEIGGINTVYYYVAVGDSGFQVHSEDHNLPSLNILLAGNKIWLTIPNCHYEEFKRWLRDEFGKWLPEGVDPCVNLLQHKDLFPKPEHIPKKFGVTFSVQTAGEIMVLDCGAIHWGFNIGYTVAAAINFSLEYWTFIYNFQELCDDVQLPMVKQDSPTREKENADKGEEKDRICVTPVLTPENFILLIHFYEQFETDFNLMKFANRTTVLDDRFAVCPSLISMTLPREGRTHSSDLLDTEDETNISSSSNSHVHSLEVPDVVFTQQSQCTPGSSASANKRKLTVEEKKKEEKETKTKRMQPVDRLPCEHEGKIMLHCRNFTKPEPEKCLHLFNDARQECAHFGQAHKSSNKEKRKYVMKNRTKHVIFDPKVDKTLYE